MHWRKKYISDIHQTDFPVLNLSEVLKQLPTLKLAWLTWFQALVGNCITLSFFFFSNQKDNLGHESLNLHLSPKWPQEKGKLGRISLQSFSIIIIGFIIILVIVIVNNITPNIIIIIITILFMSETKAPRRTRSAGPSLLLPPHCIVTNCAKFVSIKHHIIISYYDPLATFTRE